MSGLWLTLSLLYAATFLQSSASADGCIDIACDKTVCLKCNTAVTVEAGQTVTLNCSICSKDYNGTTYAWDDDAGKITCGNKKYKCDWNNRTYVSLIISNVVKDNTYSVDIHGHGGLASFAIKVQVISNVVKDNNYSVLIKGHGGRDESPAIKVQVIKLDEAIGLDATTNKKAFAWFILIPLVALGILYFLFGTNRGRKITKAIRKEKTRGDHSDMTAAPGSGDSLTA